MLYNYHDFCIDRHQFIIIIILIIITAVETIIMSRGIIMLLFCTNLRQFLEHSLSFIYKYAGDLKLSLHQFYKCTLFTQQLSQLTET